MALLAMLAIAVMVFAYVLTSRLNAASQLVGLDREHNAKVLSRAKQALIGYVAQRAAIGDDPGTTGVLEGRNPGSLPCPEAPAYYGTGNEDEGVAAGNCTLPAVGRLPWRTLGLDKLVDADGEPLWYVVSPGWALACSTCDTLINSDSLGQLTVDGVANDAVALLIAPGAVLDAQAGAGCAAWVQARPATGAPDLRNYLECDNATSPADATFVTAAPGRTFNDQVLRVRAADLLPAIEAAIADRMQREIAPALRAVYTSSQYSGIPSSSPMYPYAAPFASPATASFQGVAGTYQGLLPFSQTQGCDPATDARCTTTLLAWSSGTPPPVSAVGGFGGIKSQTCSWQSGGSTALCAAEYDEDGKNKSGRLLIEMTATINNVASGLRKVDWTNAQVQARDVGKGAWVQVPLEPAPDTRATMNANGSVTVRLRALLPNIQAMGWGHKAEFTFSLARAVIGDHFLLDPATTGAGAATSWFVRNEWYRVAYYAAAQENTAAALAAFGCTSSNCLRVNAPSIRNIRALLVLAGRRLDTQSRPSNLLSNYIEYQNADLDTLYVQRSMKMSKVALPALNAPMNDRLILVDWIAPAPVFPLASLP